MKHWNWGKGIALVYVCFMAATLSFVGFALTQKVDTVSADYYERGVRNDEYLLAEQRAQNSNSTLEITAHNTLLIKSKVSASHNGMLHVQRRDNLEHDQTLPFVFDKDGVASIHPKFPITGKWEVQAEWNVRGELYRIHSVEHIAELR